MKVGDIIKVGRLVFGVRAIFLVDGEEITNGHPDCRHNNEINEDYFNLKS